MRQAIFDKFIIPRELRRHILSFLDFMKLVILRKNISSEAEVALLLLGADINFVLRKKGALDLQSLLSPIKIEVDSKKPYQELLKIHQNDLVELILIIRRTGEISRKDTNKIITIFSHISLLNLEKLYLDHFFGWGTKYLANSIPLIHYLMAIGVGMTSSWIWQVCVDFGTEQDCLKLLEASKELPQDRPFQLSYEDEGSPWHPEIYFTIAKHNPLTQALFAQSQLVIDTVLSRSPQLALETIIFFDSILKGKYDMYVNFDPGQAQEAWKKFLRTKIPENIQVKELNEITKKSAVEIILEEISKAQSLQEVLSLYEHYGNSIILNTRQYPKWDNFCSFFQGRTFDPNYTNSKKTVLLALQSKAYEFVIASDDSSILLNITLSSDLFSTRHFKYGLSDKIYLQLQSRYYEANGFGLLSSIM